MALVRPACGLDHMRVSSLRYSGARLLQDVECPICFHRYPSINSTVCCRQQICTACFVTVSDQRARVPGNEGGGASALGCVCPHEQQGRGLRPMHMFLFFDCVRGWKWVASFSVYSLPLLWARSWARKLSARRRTARTARPRPSTSATSDPGRAVASKAGTSSRRLAWYNS